VDFRGFYGEGGKGMGRGRGEGREREEKRERGKRGKEGKGRGRPFGFAPTPRKNFPATPLLLAHAEIRNTVQTSEKMVKQKDRHKLTCL